MTATITKDNLPEVRGLLAEMVPGYGPEGLGCESALRTRYLRIVR